MTDSVTPNRLHPQRMGLLQEFAMFFTDTRYAILAFTPGVAMGRAVMSHNNIYAVKIGYLVGCQICFFQYHSVLTVTAINNQLPRCGTRNSG